MSLDVSASGAIVARFSTLFAAFGVTASWIGQAVNASLGLLGYPCRTAARGWARRNQVGAKKSAVSPRRT